MIGKTFSRLKNAIIGGNFTSRKWRKSRPLKRKSWNVDVIPPRCKPIMRKKRLVTDSWIISTSEMDHRNVQHHLELLDTADAEQEILERRRDPAKMKAYKGRQDDRHKRFDKQHEIETGLEFAEERVDPQLKDGSDFIDDVSSIVLRVSYREDTSHRMMDFSHLHCIFIVALCRLWRISLAVITRRSEQLRNITISTADEVRANKTTHAHRNPLSVLYNTKWIELNMYLNSFRSTAVVVEAPSWL